MTCPVANSRAGSRGEPVMSSGRSKPTQQKQKPALHSMRNGLRGWLRQHAYSLMYSIGNLFRHPMATMMTTAVLGLALCLPLLLWVVMGNLEGLRKLDTLESITVFVASDSQDEIHQEAVPLSIDALINELGGWSEVARVDSISPQQGLGELQATGGFGSALELLDSNPLPWVLLVIPNVESPAQLDQLLQRLEQHPGIESAQADWRWLQRLQGILQLARNALQLLAVLFGFGVILVISNTIRLDIQNRQDEIDVLALAGATHGFIRRPFLYTGFWYGALGGVVAVLVLLLAALWVGDDLARLADAYNQQASVWLPPLPVLALLIAGCGILGQTGAYIAVSQRLQALNPV